MSKRSIAVLFFSAFLAFVSSTAAEDKYLWPLDAERAVTSSFGEYRPGHLHAGLDLKTWGRMDLKVQAVEAGQVWRLRTSPWGYGKAVYLKLRDGKFAVYAHLSDFASKIKKVVEEAQEKRGLYSVDIYLKEGEIPISRGEVIGLSGRSGVDAPHLHFELRDPEGRPINPLSNGISVEDSTPPEIRQISISPIGSKSLVDGQHSSRILPLEWDEERKAFVTSKKPQVFGEVALSALTHDQADVTSNRFAPYRLELSVDGNPVFSSRYDWFPYDKTHKVDLDHNFSLNHIGLFRNLFLAQGNDLPFYGDHKVGDGILRLNNGVHRISVEALDIYGNSSRAEFDILADAPPRIEWIKAESAISSHADERAFSRRSKTEKDMALVSVFASDQDDDSLKVVIERSLDLGAGWEMIAQSSIRGTGRMFSTIAPLEKDKVTIFKASATDGRGVRSYFRTCALPSEDVKQERRWGPLFSCRKVFHQNFLELEIESSEILAQTPSVLLSHAKADFWYIDVEQTELKTYRATIDFVPNRDGRITIEIEGIDPWGNPGYYTTSVVQKTIARSEEGQVKYFTGKAKASFPPESVYDYLYPRIEEFTPKSPDDLPAVGEGYSFEPADVPFDKAVTVFLSYPEDFPKPEKLGIYTPGEEGEWKFIGNTLDLNKKAVSAQVPHFSKYALLLDEIPPSVSELRPKNASHIKSRRPKLSATTRDKGSGIGREEDIVMRLDGRRVISEYDPERENVSYQMKGPLTPGVHRLEVIVRDLSGNEASAQSEFTVE